jgi:hypothetical protein
MAVELTGPNSILTRGLRSQLLNLRGYDGQAVQPKPPGTEYHCPIIIRGYRDDADTGTFPWIITRGYACARGEVPRIVIPEIEIPPFIRGRRPPDVKEAMRRELEKERLECYDILARLLSVNGIDEEEAIVRIQRCILDNTSLTVRARAISSSAIKIADLDINAILESIRTGKANVSTSAWIVHEDEKGVIIDINDVIVRHKK